MTYTKKQFLEDVKKEAVALEKHLTPDEKRKLRIETLNPHNMIDCVYGQISGNCRNDRAVELITACCKRFMKNAVLDDVKGEVSNIKALNSVKKNVNGRKSHHPNSLAFISTLETYITLPNAKNKELIDFLKGNRKDLVL